MIPSIHPFPARMAPNLALDTLKGLAPGSLILDPMSGSGTVLRHAVSLGHQAIGFDLDPLAVLMSRVWVTPVEDDAIDRLVQKIVGEARSYDGRTISLPWIDQDCETREFVDYWFGPAQQSDLRRIACALSVEGQSRMSTQRSAALNVLKASLSRIIVTKDKGASLARDVSHSRPHRVADTSDYDVFDNFEKSVNAVKRRLSSARPTLGASIRLGDARALSRIIDGTVDMVLTSPPYLNAIDYMRGHRLSLVWLGYSLGTLRRIRSNSIGAERALEAVNDPRHIHRLREAAGEVDRLSSRHSKMVDRYIVDVSALVREAQRALRPEGQAAFVVGNSCLKGVFIENSAILQAAAELSGMRLLSRQERELPQNSRYLPTPSDGTLAKRMRSEVMLRFVKAA